PAAERARARGAGAGQPEHGHQGLPRPGAPRRDRGAQRVGSLRDRGGAGGGEGAAACADAGGVARGDRGGAARGARRRGNHAPPGRGARGGRDGNGGETMNDVVSIEGLDFAYGRRRNVLQGLDLRLAPGKVTVLLGGNGAGKSTLLRLLLGVLRPTRGGVRVFGADPLRAHAAVVRRIGYVPDVPDVYPWMTPARLYAFLAPHYPTWNTSLCAELARQLAVPLTTKFKALSRGEGMKAMLVAALASEPELLLLDEPFAGLDPLVREEVLGGIVQSLRDGERTVLCATHELEI